jgi:hypothetical protein
LRWPSPLRSARSWMRIKLRSSIYPLSFSIKSPRVVPHRSMNCTERSTQRLSEHPRNRMIRQYCTEPELSPESLCYIDQRMHESLTFQIGVSCLGRYIGCSSTTISDVDAERARLTTFLISFASILILVGYSYSYITLIFS